MNTPTLTPAMGRKQLRKKGPPNSAASQFQAPRFASSKKDLMAEAETTMALTTTARRRGEGPAQKLATYGFLPLRELSKLELGLNPADKKRFDAYGQIIHAALTDVHASPTLQKQRAAALDNPTPEVKAWLDELGLAPEELKKPIFNINKMEAEGTMQSEVLQRMEKLGLFRLKIGKDKGGLGLTQTQYSAVVQKLAELMSGAMMATNAAHNTIGLYPALMFGNRDLKPDAFKELIENPDAFFQKIASGEKGRDLLYGGDDQRVELFRDMAEGNSLASFALTELGAVKDHSGTDTAEMKTTAKLVKGDDDQYYWEINGKEDLNGGGKCYITGTQRAGVLYLTANTDWGDFSGSRDNYFKALGHSPQQAAKKLKDPRSTFVVKLPFRLDDSIEARDEKRSDLATDKGRGKLHISKPLPIHGIQGSNQAMVEFDHYRIPVGNMLGEIEIGRKVAFESLNSGRFGFLASSAATSRKRLEQTVRSVANKGGMKQFSPVGQQGRLIDLYNVKEVLANSAARVAMMQAVNDMMAALVDTYGYHNPKNNPEKDLIAEACIAKVIAGEDGERVMHDTQFLWGGQGMLEQHPISPYRGLLDSIILRIVEGVDPGLTMHAAGQGMSPLFNRYRKMMKVLSKPDMNSLKSAGEALAGLIPERVTGGFQRGHVGPVNADFIQRKARAFNDKLLRQAVIQGIGLTKNSHDLLKMGSVMKDLFALTACAQKLGKQGKTLPEWERLALVRYIDQAKKGINENLYQMGWGLRLNLDLNVGQEKRQVEKLADALRQAFPEPNMETLGWSPSNQYQAGQDGFGRNATWPSPRL